MVYSITKKNKFNYDSLNDDWLINMLEVNITQIINIEYEYIFWYKKAGKKLVEWKK